MSTSSTLFLSDLTVCDHAYIDNRGNVVGGSFNPSFFVTGEVDPVEQVVVDFSAVKKQIKQIIDDKETGFDHKLWFIDGYSNGKLTRYESRCLIETPTTILNVPSNAVKVFSATAYDFEVIGDHMGKEVEAGLNTLHPGVNITTKCINNINCHVPTPSTQKALFRYAHGLKDSTSWGCKNIAHGHLSYIQILPASEATWNVATEMASDTDDTIFIFNDNVVDGPNGRVSIMYDTCERGRFYGEYDTSSYKVVQLDTETTVEHLVEYLADKYGDKIRAAGGEMLLVSEGLSKGACIEL